MPSFLSLPVLSRIDSGKILAIWFPVAAFVAMSFEHAIADMYFIPTGMLFGADVSVGRLFWALLPATIGNAIGGGLLVGATYWYVFDSMASSKQLISRIRDSLVGRLGLGRQRGGRQQQMASQSNITEHSNSQEVLQPETDKER
jgi:Formate/nitrite transporter